MNDSHNEQAIAIVINKIASIQNTQSDMLSDEFEAIKAIITQYNLSESLLEEAEQAVKKAKKTNVIGGDISQIVSQEKKVPEKIKSIVLEMMEILDEITGIYNAFLHPDGYFAESQKDGIIPVQEQYKALQNNIEECEKIISNSNSTRSFKQISSQLESIKGIKISSAEDIKNIKEPLKQILEDKSLKKDVPFAQMVTEGKKVNSWVQFVNKKESNSTDIAIS